MIFMLTRTALWGVAVIAAAFAFVWLKDAAGGVTVNLEGRTYGPFRPLEFVAIVVGLALLIWIGFKLFGLTIALVRFFSGDETALSRFWNRSRERRGFDALSKSLTALAEGDGRAAMTTARKAERLLERKGLTRLLLARAAEASGETGVARDYYKELASDPATAYVGVKGLLEQALSKGDRQRALKLANHGFTLKPTDPELLETLFDLQCEAKDWEGARRTLHAKVQTGGIPKDVAERREAVLLIADADATTDATKSAELAARAHKKSPALAPAAVAVARNLIASGSSRKAIKMLKETWSAEPHPDIAAAFAEMDPNESPASRRRRFRDLLSLKPDHPEAKLLAAELALADNDYVAARTELGDLPESAPSARALSLKAAIERGEGASDEVVRGLLARAITAPRAPQWTCSACGKRHAAWSPRCERCEAFDSLEWREGEADPADAAAALAPVLSEPAASDDVVDATAQPQETAEAKQAAGS